MRTTIVIDDRLMADTLEATGLKSKRQAVELGLRTLLRLHRQEAIRGVRGTLHWEGDLEAVRSEPQPVRASHFSPGPELGFVLDDDDAPQSPKL